jgi:hypothetical protein
LIDEKEVSETLLKMAKQESEKRIRGKKRGEWSELYADGKDKGRQSRIRQVKKGKDSRERYGRSVPAISGRDQLTGAKIQPSTASRASTVL